MTLRKPPKSRNGTLRIPGGFSSPVNERWRKTRCVMCGMVFHHSRIDADFCSSACRQDAYRIRKADAEHVKAVLSTLADIRYLPDIPHDPIPDGRIVAHNHVRPSDFHAGYPLGLNGFRAWTDEPDDEHYERCCCEWANGRVAEHYRVRRP